MKDITPVRKPAPPKQTPVVATALEKPITAPSAKEVIEQYTEESKKRPVVITVLSVCVLLALLVVGYLLLQVLQHQKITDALKLKETTSKPVVRTNSVEISAKQTLERVAKLMNVPELTYNGHIMSHALPDATFSTGIGASTEAVALTSTDKYKEHYKVIRKELTSVGYVELPADSVLIKDEVAAVAFATDTSICRLADAKTAAETETHTVSLSCAEKSLLRDIQKAQKPFYDVYTKANETTTSSMDVALIGYPRISQGSIAGFMLADISIGSRQSTGGAVIKFYQTPNGTWHYFTSTKDIVPCEKFDTVALRQAYLNTKCYDTKANKDSLVSLIKT